jgi:hypothetical protein
MNECTERPGILKWNVYLCGSSLLTLRHPIHMVKWGDNVWGKRTKTTDRQTDNTRPPRADFSCNQQRREEATGGSKQPHSSRTKTKTKAAARILCFSLFWLLSFVSSAFGFEVFFGCLPPLFSRLSPGRPFPCG